MSRKKSIAKEDYDMILETKNEIDKAMMGKLAKAQVRMISFFGSLWSNLEQEISLF